MSVLICQHECEYVNILEVINMTKYKFGLKLYICNLLTRSFMYIDLHKNRIRLH